MVRVDTIWNITLELGCHIKACTKLRRDDLSASPCKQAFYYEEAPTMSNEEFDNLKEELLWAGSKVAILR